MSNPDINVVALLKIRRPHDKIAFKTPLPEMSGEDFVNYVKEKYIDTGKILSRKETLSEDRLELISETIWINDEERVAYINDPIVKKYLDNLINYRKANGITTEWINRLWDKDTLVKEWSGTF